MKHARVFAGLAAAESGAVAASLFTRDFMAAQYLPGQSAIAWGVIFCAGAVGLVAACVFGEAIVPLLRWLLLLGSGVHAAFGVVLAFYSITNGTSWVGATLAVFAALMYAREVLRLGGYPW